MSSARRAVDVGVLMHAVAAAATTYLPVVDYEELYYCGCSEPFRPADNLVFAPAATIAILAALSLARPGPVRGVPRVLAWFATFALVWICFFSVLGTYIGPGAMPIGLSHGALLLALLGRALIRALR